VAAGIVLVSHDVAYDSTIGIADAIRIDTVNFSR
jgi:hypothetical protein